MRCSVNTSIPPIPPTTKRSPLPPPHRRSCAWSYKEGPRASRVFGLTNSMDVSYSRMVLRLCYAAAFDRRQSDAEATTS